MKNYKQILEAVNKGIQLALDDFDDDETPIVHRRSKQVGIDEYELVQKAYINNLISKLSNNEHVKLYSLFLNVPFGYKFNTKNFDEFSLDDFQKKILVDYINKTYGPFNPPHTVPYNNTDIYCMDIESIKEDMIKEDNEIELL